MHIYILPRDVWITKQKLAYNETIQEAISAGFIRVNQELILGDMRSEIKKQCINEDVPPEYVFLRSVGRALTRVKPHQEFELKARYFLPPQVSSYFNYNNNNNKLRNDFFCIRIMHLKYFCSSMTKTSHNRWWGNSMAWVMVREGLILHHQVKFNKKKD